MSLYYKKLNSPELKALRDKVKYRVLMQKDNVLLETIDHGTHTTYKPLFRCGEIESSNLTDSLITDAIIGRQDTGWLNFKDEDFINDDSRTATGMAFLETVGTDTYRIVYSIDKISGELMPNQKSSFGYTNDEGILIKKVVNNG